MVFQIELSRRIVPNVRLCMWLVPEAYSVHMDDMRRGCGQVSTASYYKPMVAQTPPPVKARIVRATQFMLGWTDVWGGQSLSPHSTLSLVSSHKPKTSHFTNTKL